MIRHKPFIVEFTGTPEAGKTTVIQKVAYTLQHIGYTVKVYPESAELVPSTFFKASAEAKLWMNLRTAENILEAQFLNDYDFVIFDRGSCDRIFWQYLDAALDSDQSLQNSVLNSSFFMNYPPDLLITFFVSAKESIIRRGGEGRVVTERFVVEYNRLLTSFINSLSIRNSVINTDSKTVTEVSDAVLKIILEKNIPP